MPQVVEYSEFHHCTAQGQPAGRRSLVARIGAWLAGWPSRPGLVHFEHPSRHMMRDIGLGEDVRGNPLLREHNLRR